MQDLRDRHNTAMKDRREMFIPEGTITKDEPRSLSLPFHWLRTWVLSLLALIALPLGAALVLIGLEMEDEPVWEATEATVSSITDGAMTIKADNLGLEMQRVEWDTAGLDFIASDVQFALFFDPNAILFPLLVPQQEGATFTLYYSPLNAGAISPLPISAELAALFISTGAILVILSGLQLLSVIGHAAANHPQKT